MKPSLITESLVSLDIGLGPAKEDVIVRLAELVKHAGRATSAEGLACDALARESKSATGLPNGIAIPHCRSSFVTSPTLAFARLVEPVDFGAKDGPADLVFMIAVPAEGDADHMTLLTALARALVRKDFVAQLRDADRDAAVVSVIAKAITPESPSQAAQQQAPQQPASPAAAQSGPGRHTPAAAAPMATPTTPMATPSADAAVVAPAPTGVSGNGAPSPTRIVAITACPTGIAHTYLAAEALTQAAQQRGLDFAVETQGSGSVTPLPRNVIADADCVIFATDVGVRDKARFAGKPVVACAVKRAIHEPDALLTEAIAAAHNPAAKRVPEHAEAKPASNHNGSTPDGAPRRSLGLALRQALLTGVSYMIPFVAAGGLLIALGFLFGGYDITETAKTVVVENSFTNLPAGGLAAYLGAVLFQLGALAFGFLVPALAGYIAFSIADRPGIAPGFTTGAVAGFVGAGFIGGLVGGLVAGVVALQLSKMRLPRFAEGLKPVVIVPLLATLVSGGLMFMLLGRPLAAITTGLQNWLSGMSGTSAVLLGIVLGLMMCFDLGGPVNKAAYAFATAGLSVTNIPSMNIMAAVMAAGMVPPLAMAASTALRPQLYSKGERESGKAAWLLGASFISEGAIPFAAADPLRVIPAMMAGGATTGAIVMASDVTLKAPHGGIFVFFAIGNLVWFILAIVAGTLVGAAVVTALKMFTRKASSAATVDIRNDSAITTTVVAEPHTVDLTNSDRRQTH